MRVSNGDEHEAARLLGLQAAVRDSACNRLDRAERADALRMANITAERFNALVEDERRRLAAEQQQRERDAEEQRRRPSTRPLNDFTGGDR
jgi:hypothetical protein